jgi:hypothetical protein
MAIQFHAKILKPYFNGNYFSDVVSFVIMCTFVLVENINKILKNDSDC